MLNSTQTPVQPAAQAQSHAKDSASPSPAGRDEASSARPNAPAQFVCISSSLRRLLLQIEIAAPRLRLASIEGAAGTGKHLLAQTIHRHSELASLPFRRRDAREWLANEADASSLSGTLYLDRIDLLAAGGQGLLLNLLKTLQSEPPPRFILLASSHQPLRHLASQGHFLPDLAFRLTAVRFAIPPLLEHREDIAPIAQALIDRICRHYQQPTAVLAPGTLQRLLQHPWSGNVRELASALESAILDSTTGILRPADLHLALNPELNGDHHRSESPVSLSPQAETIVPGPTVDLSLDAAIHRHIQFVLNLNHGNKLRAARQLGISRSTLYRLLGGEAAEPQTIPAP